MQKYISFSLLVVLVLVTACGSTVLQAAPLEIRAAQGVRTAAQVATSVKASNTQAAAQPTQPKPVGTSVPPSQGAVMGKNLIVNGDAEAGPGAPNDTTVVSVPGWSGTGKFTTVQYGADGGFQEASSPGPQDRGKNFFVGGPDSEQSSAQQTIEVKGLATLIDQGALTYEFEAWIGGYQGQDDNATVTAEFIDANGKSLKKASLGPVMAADRKNETESLQKKTTGAVPKGTRTIRVVMTFVRDSGSYDDGSVDNLSLVLSKAGPG